MSDETAPDATQDTPTTEPETQEVDWRKRYEDLQPEFTRSRQTLTDREALLAHVAETFPDLIADDEDDEEDLAEDDGDNDRPLTKAEFDEWKRGQFEQWRGQVDSERGSAKYEKDLSDVLEGRELSKEGREIIQALTITGGNDSKALKAAVERWFAISPPASADEEPTTKRRTPHVPAGGKPATGVPNYDDMTRDQVDQAMYERALSLDTQT